MLSLLMLVHLQDYLCNFMHADTAISLSLPRCLLDALADPSHNIILFLLPVVLQDFEEIVH
jgi:hypothetical protein